MISGAGFDYRRVLSQQRPPGAVRGRVTFERPGFSAVSLWERPRAGRGALLGFSGTQSYRGIY